MGILRLLMELLRISGRLPDQQVFSSVHWNHRESRAFPQLRHE